MIRRINFYGAPCAGKTLTALTQTSHLKAKHLHVEYVSEWVKTWAYLKYVPQGFDQILVTAKQLHSEERLLRAGVDVIVTDSPLFLGAFYSLHTSPFPPTTLMDILDSFEFIYPSLNIFLDRPSHVPYQASGRFQTEEQAADVSDELWDFVRDNCKNVHRVTSSDTASLVLIVNGALNREPTH